MGDLLMNAALNYHTAYSRQRRARGTCADCTLPRKKGSRCLWCARRRAGRERGRYAREKAANSEWYQRKLRGCRERQRKAKQCA